jgi:hypothetical protein
VNRPRYDANGFEKQYAERKRDSRRQRLVVRGAASSNKLKGAPPPSRDFFIYRVAKETSAENIIDFLNDSEVQFNDVHQLSKPDSMYKSFKLSVPISQMERVLEKSLWPAGIMVRRFRPKRSEQPEYS